MKLTVLTIGLWVAVVAVWYPYSFRDRQGKQGAGGFTAVAGAIAQAAPVPARPTPETHVPTPPAAPSPRCDTPAHGELLREAP